MDPAHARGAPRGGPRVRPVLDPASHQPVSYRSHHQTRLGSAAGAGRPRRLDPRGRARTPAPRKDVGDRGPADATAAAPAAGRSAVPLAPVQVTAAGLRAELKPRDRLDARP